ncbi:MAG TPA: hypothetical protein VMT49_01860 [Steroidobacteraceae bacterium]|nr:hypothetical protein [Steroidobacteraceae bacterium]
MQRTTEAVRGARTAADPSAQRAAHGPADANALPVVHLGAGVKGLVSLACAMGGVLRDTVYVTFDALSGRYDH